MESLGTVLVVDDEVALRETLGYILESIGCRVVLAGDGPEALAQSERVACDLVVSDLRLPGLDGIRLLEALHRAQPELPVIILTAYATLESALEAVRLGAREYVLKPIQPEQFIETIRRILAAQARRRRAAELRGQIEALQRQLDELQAADAAGAVAPVSAGTPPGEPERYLRLGPLELDLHARQASLGSRALRLPPTAFDYLVTLARHAPQVVSYVQLVSETQGYAAEPWAAQDIARYHVHQVRRALEAAGNGRDGPGERDGAARCQVVNVRGVGYRLVADTARQASRRTGPSLS